jgi:hypothetical protein
LESILRISFQHRARPGVKSSRSKTARTARIALAMLFVLPFASVEKAAAQSPAVASFGLMPTEFVDTGSLAVDSLSASADPAGPACAICAAATMGDAALIAIPPLFLLPQAVELLHRTTGAEFVRLRSHRVKGSS